MTNDTEQMDLLQNSENEGWEGTPMAVFPAPRLEKPRSASEKRGPGRPKGAKNRKTQAIEKLYRTKGLRDPLIYQGQFMSSDPVDLLRQFIALEGDLRGLTLDKAMAAWKAGTLPGVPSIAEIVAMQIKVADQVTPYLYGKKPLQTEEDTERLPMLFIDLGDDSRSGTIEGDEGLLSIGQMLDDESKQNQSLKQNETGASHDKASHEGDKRLKDKGE
nr:hypothetical protein [uncultured Cohaesibacter sp.]